MNYCCCFQTLIVVVFGWRYKYVFFFFVSYRDTEIFEISPDNSIYQWVQFDNPVSLKWYVYFLWWQPWVYLHLDRILDFIEIQFAATAAATCLARTEWCINSNFTKSDFVTAVLENFHISKKKTIWQISNVGHEKDFRMAGKGLERAALQGDLSLPTRWCPVQSFSTYFLIR